MVKNSPHKLKATYGRPATSRKRKQRLALDRARRIALSEIPKSRPLSSSERLSQIFGSSAGVESSEILAANSQPPEPTEGRLKKARPANSRSVTSSSSRSEDDILNNINDERVGMFSDEPNMSLSGFPGKISLEGPADRALSPIAMSVTPETSTPLKSQPKEMQSYQESFYKKTKSFKKMAENSPTPKSVASTQNDSENKEASPVAAIIEPDQSDSGPAKPLSPISPAKKSVNTSNLMSEINLASQSFSLIKQLVSFLCATLYRERRMQQKKIFSRKVHVRRMNSWRARRGLFRGSSEISQNNRCKPQAQKVQKIYQNVKIYYDRLPPTSRAVTSYAEEKAVKADEVAPSAATLESDRSQISPNQPCNEKEGTNSSEINPQNNPDIIFKDASYSHVSQNVIPHVLPTRSITPENDFAEASDNLSSEKSPNKTHNTDNRKNESCFSMNGNNQMLPVEIPCTNTTCDLVDGDHLAAEKTTGESIIVENDFTERATSANEIPVDLTLNHTKIPAECVIKKNVFSQSSDLPELSLDPFEEFAANTAKKLKKVKKRQRSNITGSSNKKRFGRQDRHPTKKKQTKLANIDDHSTLMMQCSPGPDPIDLISQCRKIT